jgi:hypothetical protein
MNQWREIMLTVVLGLGASVYALDNTSSSYALMTASDLQNEATSNLSIQNNTGGPVTVYGLFVASYDSEAPCYGNILGGDNLGGAMVSSVYFKAGQSIPVGQSYLYNMLYNSIYYIKAGIGSSPCSLPGCSWPGDSPDFHWWIGINAVSLDSSYTYSNYTNSDTPPVSPPYGAAGLSTPYNYNYDLINPLTLGVGSSSQCVGPITCNDETLTCELSTPQTESFESYT